MQTVLAKRLLPLAAAALAMFATSAPAQQGGREKGAPGTNPGEVQATLITKTGNFEQKSPSVVAGTRHKVWGVLDVTFSTTPEWVDDMTVTFYVMLQNPKADEKKGEKPMSFFTLTLSYSDIARGRDHKVGAVLQPAALLRYGRPIGVAAKISVGGKEVATKDDGEGPLKNAEKWWENPKIVDSPKVQRRDGYLIDRMKSPFQLQDNDNYEESH
jgi:hypothetical protein